MSRGGQSMQEIQNQSSDECKQQVEDSSNKPKKSGRKPRLTADERHERKLVSGRKYRKKQTAEKKELQEKCKNLEIEIGTLKKEPRQPEMNSLKEHSESNAQADKLLREVSDESKKVNVLKMVNKAQETVRQQLEEEILNKDNQEHDAENSEYNIPMDNAFLDNFMLDGLEDINAFLDSKLSNTKEGPSSIAKAISPLRETVNVEGFLVPKEIFEVVKEIFSTFPNTALGIQFRHPASRNGFINTLAEVYKMVKREEMHDQKEIDQMLDGIKDLELAGFEISWLRDLVLNRQEEVEDEEIRIREDELKLLRESKSKRREERKSKRQRPI